MIIRNESSKQDTPRCSPKEAREELGRLRAGNSHLSAEDRDTQGSSWAQRLGFVGEIRAVAGEGSGESAWNFPVSMFGKAVRVMNRDDVFDTFCCEKIRVRQYVPWTAATAEPVPCSCRTFLHPRAELSARRMLTVPELTLSFLGASVPAERIFSQLRTSLIEKNQLEF